MFFVYVHSPENDTRFVSDQTTTLIVTDKVKKVESVGGNCNELGKAIKTDGELKDTRRSEDGQIGTKTTRGRDLNGRAF
jgi:hypothetical protein